MGRILFGATPLTTGGGATIGAGREARRKTAFAAFVWELPITPPPAADFATSAVRPGITHMGHSSCASIGRVAY